MSTALWIVGVIAVLLWLATAGVILWPPGDNRSDRAMFELLAAVPGALAIIMSIVWAILGAFHWL